MPLTFDSRVCILLVCLQHDDKTMSNEMLDLTSHAMPPSTTVACSQSVKQDLSLKLVLQEFRKHV